MGQITLRPEDRKQLVVADLGGPASGINLPQLLSSKFLHQPGRLKGFYCSAYSRMSFSARRCCCQSR